MDFTIPKNICKYYKQMYIHYFNELEEYFESSLDPLENTMNIDFYINEPGINGIWAMNLMEMKMYKQILNINNFDDNIDLYYIDYDYSGQEEFMEFFDGDQNLLYGIKEKNYYISEYNNILKKRGCKYFLELLKEDGENENDFSFNNNYIFFTDDNLSDSTEVSDSKSIEYDNLSIDRKVTIYDKNPKINAEELSKESKNKNNTHHNKKENESKDNCILFNKNEDNQKGFEVIDEDIRIKENKKNKEHIKRSSKTVLDLAISKINNINYEEKKQEVDDTNIFYNVINIENKYLCNNYKLILEYKILYDKIKNIKENIISENRSMEKKRNKLHKHLIHKLSDDYKINDSNISRYIEKAERCSTYCETFGEDNVKNCTISPRFLIELRKKDFEKFIKYINDNFN